MKHIASFIITSFIASMNLFAQDISLLDGTILHNISDKTSVPENVFDGDINTHLETSSAGGRWIGLDLGSAHVITDIEFAPQYIGRNVFVDNVLSIHQFNKGNIQCLRQRLQQRNVRQSLGGFPLGNGLAADTDPFGQFSLCQISLFPQLFDGGACYISVHL